MSEDHLNKIKEQGERVKYLKDKKAPADEVHVHKSNYIFGVVFWSRLHHNLILAACNATANI